MPCGSPSTAPRTRKASSAHTFHLYVGVYHLAPDCMERAAQLLGWRTVGSGGRSHSLLAWLPHTCAVEAGEAAAVLLQPVTQNEHGKCTFHQVEVLAERRVLCDVCSHLYAPAAFGPADHHGCVRRAELTVEHAIQRSLDCLTLGDLRLIQRGQQLTQESSVAADSSIHGRQRPQLSEALLQHCHRCVCVLDPSYDIRHQVAAELALPHTAA